MMLVPRYANIQRLQKVFPVLQDFLPKPAIISLFASPNKYYSCICSSHLKPPQSIQSSLREFRSSVSPKSESLHLPLTINFPGLLLAAIPGRSYFDRVWHWNFLLLSRSSTFTICKSPEGNMMYRLPAKNDSFVRFGSGFKRNSSHRNTPHLAALLRPRRRSQLFVRACWTNACLGHLCGSIGRNEPRNPFNKSGKFGSDHGTSLPGLARKVFLSSITRFIFYSGKSLNVFLWDQFSNRLMHKVDYKRSRNSFTSQLHEPSELSSTITSQFIILNGMKVSY